MVQHREIEDRIERSVLVWKIRDVTFYDGHSISILGKSITGSLNHFRIEVDRSDVTGTEILDLPRYAFTQSTANVEDIEPLGTASQRYELRDHASPQSSGSQSTGDVNGLRPIHPHKRNNMTSSVLGPWGASGHSRSRIPQYS